MVHKEYKFRLARKSWCTYLLKTIVKSFDPGGQPKIAFGAQRIKRGSASSSGATSSAPNARKELKQIPFKNHFTNSNPGGHKIDFGAEGSKWALPGLRGHWSRALPHALVRY